MCSMMDSAEEGALEKAGLHKFYKLKKTTRHRRTLAELEARKADERELAVEEAALLGPFLFIGLGHLGLQRKNTNKK